MSLSLKNLRCEYLHNPLGIDVGEPRLSWMIEASARGQRQSAYQILVSSSLEKLQDDIGDLWDSGKVNSDQSVHIQYEGTKLTTGMRCHWKLRIWDYTDSVSLYSAPAWWEMGLLKPEDWSGRWIGMSAESEYCPSPIVRKEINVPKKIKRARAYISGLGYYELYLNGRRIGDHVLDPGHTNYGKRALYVTYDITEFCNSGLNAVAVMLGHGWYGMKNDVINSNWGTLPTLRCQIKMEHEDGTRSEWATDETWKIASGPIIELGSYVWNDSRGEIYDARLEREGWNFPGYEDRDWMNAAVFPAPTERMSAQMHEPTRVTRAIAPASMTKLGADKVIYDFGQCFSGWVAIKVKGERGTSIRMRFGELITEFGLLDEDNVYNQQNTYILKGGEEEVWRPRFTYHGFRYVMVEGLPEDAGIGSVVGEWVHNDVADAGSFACSDDLLNRIHEAVRWTQKSLMHGGVFEDCPHRERIGYGDGHMATEEAIYNFDMAAFYTKWVQDWADTQDETSGQIYHTAPYHDFSGGGPGWGSAVVFIPWDMYLYYGDTAILETHYETMRRWIAFLESNVEQDLLDFYALHPHQPEWEFLGDWVAPRRDMTTYHWQTAFASEKQTKEDGAPFEPASGNWPDLDSNVLFNSMFFYANLSIVAKIAGLLGDSDRVTQYNRRAEAIKHAINERFFDADKAIYGNGEQPYLAYALLLDLVPVKENARVLESMVRDIVEVRDGHLDTGHFGTRFLLNALTDCGREDIAFKLVSNRTFPSWGYMIDQGATTIWEQWHPHMSRIHSCFVSVGSWFYKGLGGIRTDPRAPGFKHFQIRPFFAENISFATTTHCSMYGEIVSNWTVDGNSLSLQVHVPVNCAADVYLPASSCEDVKEQGQPAHRCTGITWLREEGGNQVFHLESGSYNFEVEDVRR